MTLRERYVGFDASVWSRVYLGREFNSLVGEIEMADKELYFERYARLLVKHGANVQPGQMVNISAEVVHRDFAYRVAQEAYRAGAASVILDLAEPRLQKFKLDSVKEEYLGVVPKHVPAKYQQILDDGGATIKIIGPEYPLLLADVSPKRVNE